MSAAHVVEDSQPRADARSETVAMPYVNAASTGTYYRRLLVVSLGDRPIHNSIIAFTQCALNGTCWVSHSTDRTTSAMQCRFNCVHYHAQVLCQHLQLTHSFLSTLSEKQWPQTVCCFQMCPGHVFVQQHHVGAASGRHHFAGPANALDITSRDTFYAADMPISTRLVSVHLSE